MTLLLCLLCTSQMYWAVLQTPKTCENFIKLCRKHYYHGTVFHRSIRNFVVRAQLSTVIRTGHLLSLLCQGTWASL